MNEYLLLKRNGNEEGLVYDKRFFSKSKDARKDFRKNDVLLKCKAHSVYRNSFGWSVNQTNIIKKYEK